MGTLGGSVANNDPSACYPSAVLGLGATVHTNKRRIEADEQLTFDYNTTEWSMDAPFACACGACSGAAIRGYAHLTSAERAQREPYVAAHLRARAVHGNA